MKRNPSQTRLRIKNRLLYLAMFITIIALITACTNTTETDDVTENTTVTSVAETTEPIKNGSEISPQDAKERLDSDEAIILVDVRTSEEYDSGHIPESILLPIDTLEKNATTQFPDLDATYFVYCRSGNRSAQAVRIMLGLGYTSVYDLGGIIDWPYEVVK